MKGCYGLEISVVTLSPRGSPREEKHFGPHQQIWSINQPDSSFCSWLKLGISKVETRRAVGIIEKASPAWFQ